MKYSRSALILVTAAFLTALIVDCTKDQNNPLDPNDSDGLSVTANMTSDGVMVTWNEIDNSNIVGYTVLRSDQANLGYSTVGTVASGLDNYSDTNIWHNRRYFYKVAAVDKNNNSSKKSESDSVIVTGATLDVSQTIWSVPTIGGQSSNIKISNGNNVSHFGWSVTTNSNWIGLSKSSGETPDSLTLSVDTNTMGLDREGRVFVTADDVSNSPDTIVVSQLAHQVPRFCLSDSSWEAHPRGSNTTINLDNCGTLSSISFSTNQPPTWLAVTPSTGNTPQDLDISATWNTTGADRSARLIVSSVDPGIPRDTLDIGQLAGPHLCVLPASWTALARGEVRSLLLSNCGNNELFGFSIKGDSSWITLSEITGQVPSAVDAIIDWNISGSSRLSEIQVIAPTLDSISIQREVSQPSLIWHRLENGVDGDVLAMTVYDNDLIIGGSFSESYPNSMTNLARWKEYQWRDMDWVNDRVRALAVYNGELVAAGEFTTASTRPANHIAKWDPNQQRWIALGSGVNDIVLALAEYDSVLIVAGSFATAGGDSASGIAAWDGAQWTPLGAGTEPDVYALTEYRRELIVGGWFPYQGCPGTRGIAAWNGADWSALGDGIEGEVFALAVMEDRLYVGGFLRYAGGKPVNAIAVWDGNTWGSLGEDLWGGPTETLVSALTVFENRLIVSGNFTMAGSINAEGLAAWDGDKWTRLAPGVGAPKTFTIYNNKLIAGGLFNEFNGSVGNHVAAFSE